MADKLKRIEKTDKDFMAYYKKLIDHGYKDSKAIREARRTVEPKPLTWK